YIIISGTTQTKDTLQPQEEWQTTFMAALDAATPLNYVVQVNLNVTGYHQFDFLQTIPLLTGFIAEDFESGNFESFDWETGGSANWFIEDGNAYEGNHNARSGPITDNQTSSLWLNWNVAFADSVSFWFKVSSEANYDFLRFFSDSEELGKWAGNWDWTYAGKYVPAGEQVFSWRYTKDYSVSNGEDCARIDYIMLPVYAVPTGIPGQVIPVSAFSVYPNPAQRDLKITWTLTETSPVTVVITDLQGRIFYHNDYTFPLNPGTYQLEPAFDGSGPGSYLIVLKTNKGTLVKKLIRTGQ
ncbi:T9SS type A sorting domain-containing protein, partial [Lentimicrobium sp.]